MIDHWLRAISTLRQPRPFRARITLASRLQKETWLHSTISGPITEDLLSTATVSSPPTRVRSTGQTFPTAMVPQEARVLDGPEFNGNVLVMCLLTTVSTARTVSPPQMSVRVPLATAGSFQRSPLSPRCQAASNAFSITQIMS